MRSTHQLRSIAISPSKNGGFTVTHSFAPKPSYKMGAKGGFGVDLAEPEEHVFGADDHAKMFDHIGKTLGIPKTQKIQKNTV